MKKKLLILFFVLISSLFIDKAFSLLVSSNRLTFLNETLPYLEYVNLLVIIVIFTLFFLLKDKKQIPPFIISIVLALSIATLLKYIIMRPRPFETLQIINLIDKTGYSFPSGHTTYAFIPLYFLHKKEFKIWLLIAIIIAFSRIYLGVHYLSDVIAGAILGIGISILTKKLYKKFLKRLS